MVLSTWKSLPLLLLPLLLVSFSVYPEWVSFPSCNIVPNPNPNPILNGTQSDEVDDTPRDNLKVMLVSSLLLMGSDSALFNFDFRDYYLSKFFSKSFRVVKPDMLLILGDVAAKGSRLSRTQWISVLHQFHRVLGPFLDLPFHVVLGDRDVGDCGGLDHDSVYWIARSFPGLDSSGCGAFEIGNVSFVSLNAVALLCGDNVLRFSVEKAIEMERNGYGLDDSRKFGEVTDKFGLGGNNGLSSGSNPVLLLHMPLHRTVNESCKVTHSAGESREFSNGVGPYELMHTVPQNATEYLLLALKPRIIFSAHAHEFCDHIHPDGTREVTVPAMSWKARVDPGFVVATFQNDKKSVSVSYCSLAKESHVLMAYTAVGVLSLTVWLLMNTTYLGCLQK
ncbi:hypothetical protein Tsubulata_041355 [Turnera subulata]|uniref:Calcineurin-like phosphoesterase domain-containing protein n=1 Tax=Turnera subulata TaxID=218843 RepID=A0A9Q0JIX8_9ROSI|nr:hypothetical protein Tsubulata_041355 [Turnera subulata]